MNFSQINIQVPFSSSVKIYKEIDVILLRTVMDWFFGTRIQLPREFIQPFCHVINIIHKISNLVHVGIYIIHELNLLFNGFSIYGITSAKNEVKFLKLNKA